jgi:hypothetical protein
MVVRAVCPQPSLLATVASRSRVGDLHHRYERRDAALCTGDCNGDDEVTANELITIVNIAPGNTNVSACARVILTAMARSPSTRSSRC